MIDVWFATGDIGASAKFDANSWNVTAMGRLNLIKNTKRNGVIEGTIIATFDAGVWQYVCAVEAEVVEEEKDGR